MGYFVGDISGAYLKHDINFQLDSPLNFYSDYMKRWFKAPTGFITDFGSLRIGMMAMVVYKKAATIHDLGYRTVGLISKGKIDRVFLEAMKTQDIEYLKQYRNWFIRRMQATNFFRRRWQCYLGVVLFGGSSYKGDVK